MIWMIFTLMIALAVAFATTPFMRGGAARSGDDLRARHFARQISEIEQEAKDGVISQPEAEALKLEAGRRLIAAGDAPPTMEHQMQNPRPIAAIAIAAIVAAAGASIYIVKGSPQTPSVDRTAGASAADAAASPAQSDIAAVENIVERLKTKLAEEPGNAEGWRMLGWSYFNIGRYRESSDAYAKAVELQPENADYQSAYGEALVMAASGFVTPAALGAFDAALSLGTDDPRAHFFKGLALDQAGDPASAISAWIDLANAAPPDADWLDGLIQRIRARAAETGVDIAGRLNESGSLSRQGPAAAPSPSQEQIEAAQSMPADQQQAMIAGMVERLADRLRENPDDPEGWVRLIKSRMVMGAKEAAVSDLKSALAAFADKPEIRAQIEAEAEALGVTID